MLTHGSQSKPSFAVVGSEHALFLFYFASLDFYNSGDCQLSLRALGQHVQFREIMYSVLFPDLKNNLQIFSLFQF